MTPEFTKIKARTQKTDTIADPRTTLNQDPIAASVMDWLEENQDILKNIIIGILIKILNDVASKKEAL